MMINRLFIKKRTKKGHAILCNSQGAVMIYLIAVMLVLSVLSAALVQLTSTSILGEISANHMTRAYYLAEAGLFYALDRVKNDIQSDGVFDDVDNIHDQTFTLDTAAGDLEGRFHILVDDSDPDFIFITTTGLLGTGVSVDGKTTLTGKIERISAPKFDRVLFSDNAMTLNANVHVTGDVGTNRSSINKNFLASVSGNIETNMGRTLTSIPFSCTSCSGDYTTGNASIDSYILKANKFHVNANTTLRLSGDNVFYIKDTMTVGSGAHIFLEEGASLTIYTDHGITFDSGSSIDFSGAARPEDAVIVGTTHASYISISDNTDIAAAIYAPTADVSIRHSSNFTGAITGNNITIDGGWLFLLIYIGSSQITWDNDTAEVDIPKDGVGSRTLGFQLGNPVQYYSQP